MRCWPMIALVGCSAGGYHADTDVDTDTDSAGCPSGMVEATTSGVTVSSFLFDGLGWTVRYDPAESLDGVPSGCVSADGTSMRLQLYAGTDPFGVISASFSEAGSYALTDVGTALELDFTGTQTPVTLHGGDVWQTGTLDVTVDPLQIDLTGTAVPDAHQLQITMSASAAY
jgi:hypothetical protein